MNDEYEKSRKIIVNIILLFFLSVDYFTGVATAKGRLLFQSLFIFVGPCVVNNMDYILLQKHSKKPLSGIKGYGNVVLLIISFVLIVFAIVAAFNEIQLADNTELLLKLIATLYLFQTLEIVVYYIVK